MGRFDAWVRSQGTDPDPRFTLANERTFLTWVTASLGMLGIGLAVDTILPQDSWPIDVLALAWVVVSAVLAVRAMLRWLRLERAMRQGEGLPLSTSIPIVAITIAVLGLLSGIAVIAAS